MQPDVEIRGERVRLVPCRPEHHDDLRRVHRHPDVARWWGDPPATWPATDEEPGAHRFTVLGTGGDVIGFVQWHGEDEAQYRHAGMDLFVDPALHGHGVGTEVVALLAAHLVDVHGYHRLVIDPDAGNAAAIACYRKVGFREVGIMRRYSRVHGDDWRDGLLMDLLADELVRSPTPP